MEKKTLVGYFSVITDVFYYKEARTFSRPFCPNLRFCFDRVHNAGSPMERFVSKRSSSSVDLDSSSRDEVRVERAAIALSENGWATTTTILQLAASLDDVMNPSKEEQSWILLQDTASIHASEATLAAMKAYCASSRHEALRTCSPAKWLSSLASRAASRRRRAPLFDGSFEGLAMNKAWRRQSSAEWVARAVTDLCDENKAWTTGWRPLRAHNDANFQRSRCRGRGTPFPR